MLVLLRRGLLLLALLAAVALPAICFSQGSNSDGDGQPPDPVLAIKLTSPRATMRTFIEASNENDRAGAVACLDLSALDPETRSARGQGYAYKLKEIIDRMWRVDYELIPDDPDSTEPYLLSQHAVELSAEDRADAGQIRIQRGGKDNLWRFSGDTVAAIDALWLKWDDRAEVQGLVASAARETFDVWLEGRFPKSLRQTHFLLPDYQWICLLVLIFLGLMADLVTRGLMNYLTSAWTKYAGGEGKEQDRRKTWRPLGLLAQALVWYGGARLIGLPDMAMMVLLAGLKLFAVVAGIWTAFRMIDLLARYMTRKALSTDTKFDDLLVPLVSKSLKIFVVCVGALTCAQAFDLPIAGLLGGLGIGGAALAFASQDAVSNVFGSVTVLVDRPFEIGDWIITDGAEGTVESVGFRSTRIRTFYNSLITLPNSRLTTSVVDNMGQRRYRRLSTTLALPYDSTPEQIEAFCEGVREIIRRHPYTRKDYYHVYLNHFGDSSLDVMLYCFWECPDWSVELRERHRLLVDILKLADQLGLSFAFPTRTLHMVPQQQYESPPPRDLSDAARAGQQSAAQIVGPLPAAEERPGGVAFTGPSDD